MFARLSTGAGAFLYLGPDLALRPLWLALIWTIQMNYVLGEPFVTGRFRVTIVSRQVVDGRVVGRFGIAVHCSKTPVFVLVDTPQDTIALDVNGAKVPLEDVHALCQDVVSP